MEAKVKATRNAIEIIITEGSATDEFYYKKFQSDQAAPKAEAYLNSQLAEINKLLNDDQESAIDKLDECIGEIEYAASFELTKSIQIPMP